MKSIVVFCGAGIGSDPVYKVQAQVLGKIFSEQGITLIYGGANIGLMGAIADAVLAHGGTVKGVIPDFLQEKEIAHQGIQQLVVVKTMHERKAIMNEMCEGIIALPGGYGTMEELFEMLTWAQLGLHTKPIGILNVNGFYDALQALIHTMVEKGFLKPQIRDMLIIENDPQTLLKKMKAYVAPDVKQWITDEKT